MAEASDTPGMIAQNLKDAGCDAKTTRECMTLVERGDFGGMLPILISYRKTLLGTVRTGQKQLDCLDYLIYTIQKRKAEGHCKEKMKK